MALVFQYGSNMFEENLNSNTRLEGTAKKLGIACTVNDFEYDFTVWSTKNNCAAADLVPWKGRKIWGVLYYIPDERVFREICPIGIKCLDMIEKEGINYSRVFIELIRPDGTRIDETVITYLGKNKQSGLKTSQKYVNKIMKGLQSNELPPDYIDYIKGRIKSNNPELC